MCLSLDRQYDRLMEFLERLLARTHKGPPLVAGSFSDLAADARDESWIEQCVAAVGTQESSFATHLLVRSLRADSIVAKIETDETVSGVFEGTSRDIMLYEVLLFCLHGISDAVRCTVLPDTANANIHFSNLAFLAAGKLGLHHIGNFDVSTHRLARAKQYLRCAGNLPDITGCLIDNLLSARTRAALKQSENSSRNEVDIVIQTSLRATVHAADAACILENAQRLTEQYVRSFDRSLFESERNRSRDMNPSAHAALY